MQVISLNMVLYMVYRDCCKHSWTVIIYQPSFLPMRMFVLEDSFTYVRMYSLKTQLVCTQVSSSSREAYKYTCSVNSSTRIQTAHEMMHKSRQALHTIKWC